jgi:hypothetical protein
MFLHVTAPGTHMALCPLYTMALLSFLGHLGGVTMGQFSSN